MSIDIKQHMIEGNESYASNVLLDVKPTVTDNPLMESKDNVSDYETTTIKNEPLSDTEEEDHSNQPVIGGYRSEDSASERLLGEVTISTKSEVSNNDQRLTETTKKTKEIKRKRSNVNSKAKPKKKTEEIGGSNKGHNGGKPDAKSRKKGSRDAEPAAKEEEESEPAVYPCTICNKVFNVRNYLNKHIRNFHVYEPSTCDICGKTYDNKTKLKRHRVLVHFPTPTIHCKICRQSFESATQLADHMTHHPAPRLVTCVYCKSVHQSEKALRTHLMIMHRDLFDKPVWNRNAQNDDSSSSTQASSIDQEGNADKQLESQHDQNISEKKEETSSTVKLETEFSLPTEQPLNVNRTDFNISGQYMDMESPMEQTSLNSMGTDDTHEKPLMKGIEIIGPMPYECRECGRGFFSRSGRSIHMKREHTNEVHTCEICGQVYTTKRSLKMHQQKDHSTESHPCEVCGKIFTHRSALLGHMRYHGDATHQCQHCPSTFKTYNLLSRHVRNVHEETDPHPCEICGQLLKTPTSLKNHKLAKHPDELLLQDDQLPVHHCTECDFKTMIPSELKRHCQNRHSTTFNFECDVCHKTFGSKHKLNEHAFIHTNIRNFICNICGDAFKRKHHLDNHMAKHSKVKSFRCSICDRAFALRQVMEMHMLTHSGEKPFSCDVCNKGFIRKTLLNKHKREGACSSLQQL